MASGGSPKASELKAALARLIARLEQKTLWDGAETDLALILSHYAKLTRPKVSRKGRYVKGRAFEYEVRDDFTAAGLRCRRVAQSGGGAEKDDLVLTTGWDEEYRLEAKRVAKLPAYLDNPQCDATVFRMDRGDALVLVSLKRFIELCQ